jgi:phosphatidylglycerol---prolipoprotein diacylglyceryl transferase
MTFPVYIPVGTLKLHPHFIFELAAYAIAFRVYLLLRKRFGDVLEDGTRWWMIATAAMGAVVGSRLLYWFEDPALTVAHWRDPAFLMGGKTIVGALIGGLFAVEVVKRLMNIALRTGDLFAVPLCVGIAIGRIGCFLTGLEDHTSGIATSLPWGINFGDGITRHPTQLYEVIFALALGMFLWRKMQQPFVPGDLFKMFMVAYFSFRFICDFFKPEVRVFLSMSSIQWACAAMLVYYWSDWIRWSKQRRARLPREHLPSIGDSLNSSRRDAMIEPYHSRISGPWKQIGIVPGCSFALAFACCGGGFAISGAGAFREAVAAILSRGGSISLLVFVGACVYRYGNSWWLWLADRLGKHGHASIIA